MPSECDEIISRCAVAATVFVSIVYCSLLPALMQRWEHGCVPISNRVNNHFNDTQNVFVYCAVYPLERLYMRVYPTYFISSTHSALTNCLQIDVASRYNFYTSILFVHIYWYFKPFRWVEIIKAWNSGRVHESCENSKLIKINLPSHLYVFDVIADVRNSVKKATFIYSIELCLDWKINKMLQSWRWSGGVQYIIFYQ